MTNTTTDNYPASRKRVAILGGGLGGLSAAYELTKEPGWQERYEVTVYQKGWRLGGKGASGRGESDRIEEHGLHCFWGFYDNAFAMLDDCYGLLKRARGPVRTIDEAFKPLKSVLFLDRIMGRWCRYDLKFPENAERPGQGPSLSELSVPQLLARYVGQLRDAALKDWRVTAVFERAVGGELERKLAWLATALRIASDGLFGPSSGEGHLKSSGLPDPLDDARELLGQLTGARIEDLGVAGGSPPPPDKGLELLDLDDAYALRLFGEGVLFAAFVIRGIVADGIPSTVEGFDADIYDGRDMRTWLADHGAPRSLLDSQVVLALYNASFCYPEGDFTNGNLAAGVSLRTVLLMGFTYKGAFMWKMQGSMGDVVFAPLYEALAKRGVKFEFFHDVKKLSLSAHGDGGGRVIERIELARQAIPKGGHYDPLIEVKELRCWPAQPRYEALENGSTYEDIDLESDWSGAPPVEMRTLERGAAGGFDHVVLAIPIAALPAICGELIEAEPRWQRMVKGIKTIRTKSFQLWLKPSKPQADWLAKHCLMTDVYRDDFNSLADMSQTLPHESWKGEVPGSAIYFSTAMADDPNEPARWSAHPGYQNEQDRLVRGQAHDWLSDWQDGIFPFLGKKGYDPNDYVSEFHRANVNADQRYTLSVAGSAKARLAPGGSGFANLFLAGDWTRSRLNLGCAEGATMSGLEAGRAVRKAMDAAVTRATSTAAFAMNRRLIEPSATRMADRSPLSLEGAPAVAPSFIDYPGMPVFPPPYRQKDVTFCQFILQASGDRMQAVVDRYLNVADPDRRCIVLGSWAILQTGHIASNTSGGVGARYGTGQETSAAFLIPVVRWRGLSAPGPVPIEVGFFAPFVFVDHPLSLIAGRETLGMAKHLATFSPGGGPMNLDNMSVATMVVDKLDAASPIELLPLIHVRRGQPKRVLSRPTSTFDTVTEAVTRALIGETNQSEAVCELLQSVFGPRQVPFFSVRQLRDGIDPTRAAFQEVTRGVMHLKDVDLRILAKGHTIELVKHASHPIAELLGLGGPILTPIASVRIKVGEATLHREM